MREDAGSGAPRPTFEARQADPWTAAGTCAGYCQSSDHLEHVPLRAPDRLVTQPGITALCHARIHSAKCSNHPDSQTAHVHSRSIPKPRDRSDVFENHLRLS